MFLLKLKFNTTLIGCILVFKQLVELNNKHEYIRKVSLVFSQIWFDAL